LKLRGGEFVESDLQSVFNVDDKVRAACLEIFERCFARNSILVFSSGVAHAESIADTLRMETSGERVEVVTGETMPLERQMILSDFKSGRLRWLVNCDVLTTGFDAPCIDAICVLRATMSPGLFAQMVGRGLRKHESKQNCLVLDFGGNIKRHGSLDDPQYGRTSIGKAAENGRGKECPNCGIDCPAGYDECFECGFVFPKPKRGDPKHDETADDESTLTGQDPPEEWIVASVSWQRHTKRNDPEAPPTLRINYDCAKDDHGMLRTQISEWVCIEHQGFALQKARQWWLARSNAPVPETVEEALSLLSRGAARMSSNITTKKEGKWYRITACSFVDEKPDEWEEEKERVVMSGFDDDVPF
jgi:DNA repair protein RadD